MGMRFEKRHTDIAAYRCKRLLRGDYAADTFDERAGIKFRPKDLIRAVGEIRDAPVADERDLLGSLCRFYLRADVLGFCNALFAFNIHEHEIVRAMTEHGESARAIQGRVNVEAGDPQDFIAERT